MWNDRSHLKHRTIILVSVLFMAFSSGGKDFFRTTGHRIGAAWGGETAWAATLAETRAAEEGQTPSTRRISLNGAWQLTYGQQPPTVKETVTPSIPPGWTTIPATVPGNVELDMVAAGKLQDPSVGNRIFKLRDLETYQWWFRRRFSSPAWEAGERINLVFDGLDCFGTIWVNGKVVGKTDDMLIPHQFDVTDFIRPRGDNEVIVRIDSSLLEGRKYPHPPLDLAGAGHYECLFVRKASHMYNYDIMPRMLSAGLWRGVALEIVKPTHWRSVYWTTLKADPRHHSATVLVDWDLVTERYNLDDLHLQFTLKRQGRVVHQSENAVLATHGRAQLALTGIDLWWPRGYGEPALYDAALQLIDSRGKVLDENRCRLGVRTIELHRTDITTPENPGDFAFVVNGERIFVRGTDWVSLDGLHSRDGKFLRPTVDMLVDLNCNLIRCYGGNVYSDHDLLDLCDENGVMVWQEFALGNARYPQTPEFQAQMRHEAEVVVSRIRNHPSIALWTGGNEIDDSVSWSGFGADPNTDLISRQVFPQVVQQYDPLRAYLPSSPYRSPELIRLGNRMDMMPEVHLWGPRGYYKGEYYTKVNAHFVSEIGYHGCPSRRTLEQMLDPEYVYPWVKDWQWNDEWLTKSVRWHPRSKETDGRNDLMVNQLKYLFGTAPRDLDDFIAASQITQAEALKFFIEFWRQGKGQRTGIIWWNLRDGWPILSDAVVDYYNRKKLAYAYIKQVQVNVVAICGEAVDGKHPVYVVNDTLQPVAGHVTIRDADTDRQILDSDFQVGANGKALISQIPQASTPEMWLIDWQLSDGSKFKNHYLEAIPPIRLEDYRRWMVKLGLPAEAEWIRFGVDGKN